MSKVKIEYQNNGLDVNGNKKFLYNFMLDGENVNHLFKAIGRSTKKGINSQYFPTDVENFLSQFGFWNNLETGDKLGKAQKNIDRCNCKKGCRFYCNSDRQGQCEKILTHSQLMSDVLKIQEFRNYKFD